jgi:hypothetical protein
MKEENTSWFGFKCSKQSFVQHVKNVLKDKDISDITEFERRELTEIAETFQEKTFKFFFEVLNFLLSKEDCDQQEASSYLEDRHHTTVAHIEKTMADPKKADMLKMLLSVKADHLELLANKKVRVHNWLFAHGFIRRMKLGKPSEGICFDCGKAIHFNEPGGHYAQKENSSGKID